MKNLPTHYSCLVNICFLFLFAGFACAQEVVTVTSNKRGTVRVAASALPVSVGAPFETRSNRLRASENLAILTTAPEGDLFDRQPDFFCSSLRPGPRRDIKAVGGLNCGPNSRTPCYWSEPVILVGFINGTPELKQAVRDVVAEWTVWANIAFVIDDNSKFSGDIADIKILFNSAKQHNSYLGIDSWRYARDAKDKPSMNLGFLDVNSAQLRSADGQVLPWIKGTILHEFGHALGLNHEHQNPEGGIQWNREEVIRALQGPPNNWSVETIEWNIFRLLNRDLTQFTRHDPSSIMHYSFPANWTKNGVAIPQNDELSETDKDFIAQKYPRRKASIDTTQYYRLTTWHNNRKNCLGVGVQKTGATESYFPYLLPCDYANIGQNWRFTRLANGDYRLSSQLLGPQLSITDASFGLYVDMGRTGNYNAQHWNITSLDKYYRLSSALNGQTYSFTAAATPNSRLYSSRTGGWSNQLWEFIPAGMVR